MKNKAKWIVVAVAVVGLIAAVAEFCLAVHRLGCIALFDEEIED